MSGSEPAANSGEAIPAPPPAAPPPPVVTVPLRRTIACICASILLWTTQGMGLNLVSANTYQLQGNFGASLNEINWLVAAYMAPNVSLTILLTKIRTQFGLRRFAEISLAVFFVASALHLLVTDLHAAVAVRFLAGIAAAPMSTLGFLYMLDAFPPAKKFNWGLALALTLSTIMPTVARVISPALLDMGGWTQLYTLELGMAMVALPVVYLLPLTPIPHSKVLEKLDFISYPLIAIGFGSLAVVMALGRLYWWFEAPWIGVLLAISVLAIALVAAVEMNREMPLMNVRWLLSREILHVAGILMAFRIVLSEQTSGAIGLFQTIGLLNEQSETLFLVILGVSILGGFFCGAVMTQARVPMLYALSLACVALGAWMDGHATNLTRPQDMYLSQALIAFGSALFLPPALLDGLMKTLKQGATYITSFIAVFLFTQSLGGLMGSAFFSTLVIIREKYHSSYIVEHLRLTNPLVVERIRALSAGYGKVLPDSQLLNAEGVAQLAAQATREANILAYNDAFLLISAMALIALAYLMLHTGYARFRAWSDAARTTQTS